MLGPIFVFTVLAVACWKALANPRIGIIGFYGFLLLDPAWNWRWSLPQGIPYQQYVFYAVAIGFVLAGCRVGRQSKVGLIGLYSLAGFVSLCYLSGLQSISWRDTEFFLTVFWKIALLAALAILLLDDAKHLRALLVVAALAQGYNAFQINLDYFQTGFSRYAYSRWGSFGVDNNGYSLITVPVLGTSLAFALASRQIKWKLLFLAVSILQIHQIMLMASRGAMLGGVVSALFALIFMPRTRINFIITCLGVFLSAALAGPFVTEEFSSSFASSEDRDSSAASRFLMWQAGYRITMDYPLLGVGPNAARRLVPLPQYYDGGLDQGNKALHNLWFDVSTGVGIPGLCIYSLFFFMPLYYCYRHRNSFSEELSAPCLAVLTGLPGYAVASMFNSGILFESVYILIIVGYACANVHGTAARQS